MRQDFAIPNGPVHALVEAGGTLFVGGDFTRIGPRAAFGAVLSATSGEPVWRPKIDDHVLAVAPDGAGGWFIGGSFERVGGAPHERLAHLRPDGSIAPWSATLPGASVYTLAVEGSTVYVGGNFAELNGQTRINVAALEGSSGALRPWDAALDPVHSSWVGALAVSGGRVYIGGQFSTPGLTHQHLVAVDAISGALLDWHPVVDGFVSSIAVGPDAVYIGGSFTTVDGVPRTNLAAVDLVTGRVTPWNPGADGAVWALGLDGSTLYVGGSFGSIGGVPRRALAAFERATGALTAWDPGLRSGHVSTLAVSGSAVYVGGGFLEVGGARRDHVAAIDPVTAQPTGWDPGAYDQVTTLAVQGDRVLVGGLFSSIGAQRRRNLAAVDVATGNVSEWNPGVNHTVRALAVEGGRVYAGGSFDSIGDQRRRRIAEIDAATGTATDWNPGANGSVRALAVSGPLVYAGGLFTSIGGQIRHRVAALDRTSGLATGWDPGADSTVRALQVVGPIVYAGGTFRRIGGADRPLVAALDASTGAATPWSPTAAGSRPDVYALAARGPTLYVAGDFSHLGGQPRRGLAALDLSSGLATPWSPNVALTRYALGLEGQGASGEPEIVYAGGDGVVALDGGNGGPVGWQPDVSGPVFALAIGSAHVMLGGNLDVSGLGRARLAAVATHTTPTLLALFTAETVREGIRLRWRLGVAAPARAWIERADRGSGPWAPAALEEHDQGEDHVALDREVEPGRTYHYRLVMDQDGQPVTLGEVIATAGPGHARTAFTGVAPVPSTGRTAIDFVLARAGRARLRVFDIRGRIQAELLDRILPAGNHRVVWSGEGARGPAPAGIYFVRLDVAGLGIARRIALSR